MLDSELDPVEPICGSAEAGALAHLYRAEVYRSTTWRQRLDMTTNWAVVTTGIALSVSFASSIASPLPIVLVGLLSAMFLFLEARRYRYFSVWKFRARVLELAVYVPILRGQGMSIPQDSGHPLSDDYIRPRYRISMLRAIGRRLRRNYAAIFSIQALAYFAKIAIHPTDAGSLSEMLSRAALGPLPGWVAIGCGAVFHSGWMLLAIFTWIQDRADTMVMADYIDTDLQ